jgi:hypothetical protein
VLALREVSEDTSDIRTSPVGGSLGDPVPFTDFPKCRKCSAEGEGVITVSYQLQFDVLMCTCVKCGFQWDMFTRDRTSL